MIDTATAAALDCFMARFEALQRPLGWPRLPYDPAWPSPCHPHSAEAGVPVAWRPVRNEDGSDMFARLAAALETDLHPALTTLFSRYWSDPLPARLDDDRQISLLQVWNADDMERLRANLIGHALNTRRQKRPLTLFFATVEPDSDYFLSLANADGSVWLEQPGQAPQEQLADSLAELLDRLQPLPFNTHD